MSYESPIQNINNIDILGERIDGGVDLIIVASGPLDGSLLTLNSLEEKIKNYASEVSSQAFIEQFGQPDVDKFKIIVVCEYSVDIQILDLLNKLKPYVSSKGAILEIRESME